MPVDEFGREIPAATARLDSPLHAPRGGLPASAAAAAAATANDGEGDTASDRHPRSSSSRRSRSAHRHHQHHHPHRSSSASQHQHHHRSRSGNRRSPRDRSRDRGGSGSRRSKRTGEGSAAASAAAGGGTPASAVKKNHPSFQYTDEPLQCEFVWKDNNNIKDNDDNGEGGAAGSDDDNNNNNNNNTKTGEEDEGGDHDVNGETETALAAATEESAASKADDKDPASASSPSAAAYDAYRKQYCLNYIRSFFNKHLDDSWFRLRYSPAVRCQYLLRERQRARREAARMRQAAASHPAQFLQQVSLSHGRKPSSSDPDGFQQPAPAQHLLSIQQQMAQDSAGSSTAASTATQAALHLQEIPPHVTDEQLLLALRDHLVAGKKFVAADWHVWPASTVSTEHLTALQRECVIVGPAGLVDDVWQALQQHSGGGATAAAAAAAATAATVVPRKSGELGGGGGGGGAAASSSTTAATSDPNKAVELDVECSDHYGRLEYDADGRGGAPADGLSVPVRKSVVTVQKLAGHGQQQSSHAHHHRSGSSSTSSTSKTVTLSAALSSHRRIENDKEAAITMAQALDQRKGIATTSTEHNIDSDSSNYCLQDILQPDWSAADMLDVAIAYLRRVHLVSFYNGCAKAETVGDVLMGKSPVSTIHLRLSNADELLAGQGDEENEKDLLVRRLDDSIAKALEECESHDNNINNNSFVDEETQAAADAIAAAEEQVQDKWLDDHAITDADGRARCSFRFCHKLFKDSTFLHKHLLKKHGEFLRAEQAKCHDENMMRAWDASADRPVPDVMVDCGALLGCVAVPVSGQIPDCVDPEPELWRRQEEYRQRENAMKARREELRQQQQQQRHQQRDAAEDAPRAPPPPRNFVDVDDMKEEKVELSFDNIPVPEAALPVKKKKKKRKLL